MKEDYKGSPRHYCHCKCDCGNERDIRASCLTASGVLSCGCYHKKVSLHPEIMHTRFYVIWHNMKQRCNNPHTDRYKNYGGRGITYTDRWEVFNNFYVDMCKSYQEHVKEFGEKQTTIDRLS